MKKIQVCVATYQFPGIADVVRVFAVVPESVGVPGQRGVQRHSNNLTAQRKAARKKNNNIINHKMKANKLPV